MGVAFIVFGLTALVLGVLLRLRASRQNTAKASWRSVAGTVESSRVAPQTTASSNGAYVDRFAAFYTYTAGGSSHRGLIYSDRKKHHPELARRYAPGAALTVFHDPDRTDRSEVRDKMVKMSDLDASLATLSFVLIPGGLIFALAGLAVAMG